jgi:Ca2+-binding RTX toxin-like protein
MLSRLIQRFFSRAACAPAETDVAGVVSEGLENRVLFSGATIISRVLTVTGSTSPDIIEIYQKSATSTVSVFIAGSEVSGSPFALGDFDSILVNADTGDDEVTLGSSAHGLSGTYGSAYDTPVTKPAVLHGDADSDTLKGGDGNDTLEGEGGLDFLFGAAGNDVLRGEDDADELHGETGNDTMYGGNGNDTILAEASADGADVMYGDGGTDKVDYSARLSGAMVITIDNSANDGLVDADPNTAGNQGEADNVRTDVEWLVGGGGADSITGSANNETLHGGSGNDTITGGSGDDDITGGGGNDTMYGGFGNDTFHSSGDGAGDYMNGESGTDTATDIGPGDFFENCEIY